MIRKTERDDGKALGMHKCRENGPHSMEKYHDVVMKFIS